MWGMLSITATEMVSARLKKKYVTHFQSAHLGVSTCKMYIYMLFVTNPVSTWSFGYNNTDNSIYIYIYIKPTVSTWSFGCISINSKIHIMIYSGKMSMNWPKKK